MKTKFAKMPGVTSLSQLDFVWWRLMLVSSVRSLLYVTDLATRILRWFLDVWPICAPVLKTIATIEKYRLILQKHILNEWCTAVYTLLPCFISRPEIRCRWCRFFLTSSRFRHATTGRKKLKTAVLACPVVVYLSHGNSSNFKNFFKVWIEKRGAEGARKHTHTHTHKHFLSWVTFSFLGGKYTKVVTVFHTT
jgi:hypothetical protein